MLEKLTGRDEFSLIVIIMMLLTYMDPRHDEGKWQQVSSGWQRSLFT